jgi:hypothetical protein
MHIKYADIIIIIIIIIIIFLGFEILLARRRCLVFYPHKSLFQPTIWNAYIATIDLFRLLNYM